MAPGSEMPFKFFSIDLERECAKNRKQVLKKTGLEVYSNQNVGGSSIPTEGVIIDRMDTLFGSKKDKKAA